jgi:ABC-type multidrug transport system fused ATPase/permease subunit
VAAWPTVAAPPDGDTDPARADLRSLWRLLRPHRPALAVAVAIAFVGAAAALAQPLLARRVIAAIEADQPVVGLAASSQERCSRPRRCRACSATSAAHGEALVLETRTALVRRLLRLPVAELDRRRTGDLISRVGADTTLLRTVVTSGLVDLVSGVVIAGGRLVAMAFVDRVLLGVTVVAVVVGLSLASLVVRRLRSASLAAQTAVGAMTAGVERALSGVRTIRAARAEEREAAVVDASSRDAFRAGLRLARLEAVLGPVASVAAQGAFLAVLGSAGARVAAGPHLRGRPRSRSCCLLFLLVQPLARRHLGVQRRADRARRARPASRRSSPCPEETAGRPRAPRSPWTASRSRSPSAGAASSTRRTAPDRTRRAGAPRRQLHRPGRPRTALVGPSGAGKSHRPRAARAASTT